MTPEHSSYVKIAPRPLSVQETEWVREIILSNPEWADVELRDLRAMAECTCGCRSIAIEEPAQVQNSKFIGHQGLVGEIELVIKINGREDIVTVLLHFANGSLSLLEVVWYNFPEPVPRSWIEIRRMVSAG